MVFPPFGTVVGWSWHLNMSELPPSAARLRCLICLRTFKESCNLVTHRIRKHGTLSTGANARGATSTRRGVFGSRLVPTGGAARGGGEGSGSGDGDGDDGGEGHGEEDGLLGDDDEQGDTPAGGGGVIVEEDGFAAAVGARGTGGASGAAAANRAASATDGDVAAAAHDAVDGGAGVGGGNMGGRATHDAAAGVAQTPIKISFNHTAIADTLAGMDEVVRLKRRPARPPPGRKRKAGDAGDSPTDGDDVTPPLAYKYSSVTTEVRSFYEDKKDWSHAEPLLKRRKTCAPGRFDSVRLRALQTYALTSCPSGCSLKQQEALFDFLDTWDGTKPGMVVDDGHYQTLRDAFGSVNGFKDGLRDDIDDAVLEEGWFKCQLEEGGVVYEAYFRSVLAVALKILRDGKDVKLWSGGDRPAPPINNRESPLDGDAFRLCEAAVMAENGQNSFVLAFHVFSDASQLAWSGGKLAPRV